MFCTFYNATSHNVELIKKKTKATIEKVKEISKEEIKQVKEFQKQKNQEGKEQNKRNFEKLKSFFKIKKKCKNKINAKVISKLSSVQLKNCGLSGQKVRGIKSLAKQILDKSFNPKLIPKMSDEEAIIYLSQLRQIGRWSAEMILLFTYNRSNIWPIQDIGLLRGISKNYKKKYLPPDSYVMLLSKRFSPYCSVATWYLWRSIDPEPIQY